MRWGLVLLAGVFALNVSGYFPFRGLDDTAAWYAYTFSAKRSPARFVGIEIDEYSLKQLGQRWPWRRDVYAQLVDVVGREGAHTLGFDLAFVGASDYPDDDTRFTQALRASKVRTVLGYFFDPQKAAAVFPYAPLREAAFSCGMVNTPFDRDGKNRRQRAFIEYEGQRLYSFSLAVASAFRQESEDELSRRLPLLPDKTYRVNYRIKPKDIVRVSFSDCLFSLGELKHRFGDSFLKGALVVVYPASDIVHRDIRDTPLGRMPGGLLHLNAIENILAAHPLRNSALLLLCCLLVSYLVLSRALVRLNFLQGFLIAAGIAVFLLWLSVAGRSIGLTFDYDSCILYLLLYYAVGWIDSYRTFTERMRRIKAKATLDPLSRLFTLRQFYFYLFQEIKHLRVRKKVFLVFIDLKQFVSACDELSVGQTQDLWKELAAQLELPGSFWSLYAQGQLLGAAVSTTRKANAEFCGLLQRLQQLFSRRALPVDVSLAAVPFTSKYPVGSVVLMLAESAAQGKGTAVLLAVARMREMLRSAAPQQKEHAFIESLDEDIEEKNTQLLLLLENLKREHGKTKEAFFQIISSLVNALEAKDPYTEGHSERVSRYALRLALTVGWGKEEQEKLRKAALLHDLGKIGIPDQVLHKRGKLDDQEFDIIRKHEVIGVRILEPLTELREILPWILYHHEKWDGSGYPHGLAGSSIPEGAQIISLADVYDALTTGRDYKPAFSQEEALAEIERNSGRQFNPQLVSEFVKLMRGEGKIHDT